MWELLGLQGVFGTCRSGGTCAVGACRSADALAEEESALVLAAQPALSEGAHACGGENLGSGTGTAVPAAAAAAGGLPDSARRGPARRPGGLQDWFCGDASPVKCQGANTDDIAGPLINEAMSTFIRSLLRGICIEVLLDDGSVIFPETSLNSELTHLTLDVNEVQRAIALRDVESVATARELRTKSILTSIQPFLDDRCCTLILRGFEFVTFRLDNERHREYFSACLALLVARSDDPKPARVAHCGVAQVPRLQPTAPIATPVAMSSDASAGLWSVAAVQQS